ncbi:MAG: alpha/beta hydrolase [Solirubrobacteraceae bacterium]
MTAQRESSFAGTGGVEIFWRAWLPDGDPGAVVVIAHGAGEHSGRYTHVAQRLVDEGYAVYAIEHRGHGRSQGPRALIDRIDNAVADLDGLVLLASDPHPGAPVFLLGHSMGGTIALSYALAHQERLAGLVLSGPLAALETVPAPMRMTARTLSVLAPRTPLIAIDSSLVSRDPAVVSDYRSDPLVHHGKLPARTVVELAGAIEAFPGAVGAITVPTLIMYGTDDGLCPPQGSVMLSERIGSPDKTLKAYQGLYHEILCEPERDQVLDDLCSWLSARVAQPADSVTPSENRQPLK